MLAHGFASFPHGTCTLLDSSPYLALDGIHHLLELQSQTPRLCNYSYMLLKFEGGVSPSDLPSSKRINKLRQQEQLCATTRLERRFGDRATGASLAITGPIQLCFFSST